MTFCTASAQTETTVRAALDKFATCGYATPLSLLVRLRQTYANANHRLPIYLAGAAADTRDLSDLRLQYTGRHFVVSTTRPLRDDELFQLQSLNAFLRD